MGSSDSVAEIAGGDAAGPLQAQDQAMGEKTGDTHLMYTAGVE